MAVMDRPATHEALDGVASQAGWATHPALAYDGTGTLWIAWLERLQGADAVYVMRDGGEPREVAQAEAIKDGPALAWTAADGLCCAWQHRSHTGAAGRDQEWRLKVATHLDGGAIGTTEAIETGAGRPSHPVLVSDGERLFLGYELHDADGAEAVVRARQGDGWSEAVALSRLARPGVGAAEGVYELALAVAPDGVVWAAWVEAREAGFAVWAVHAPVERAHDAGGWLAPERISGGPHLPSWPRLLATGRGVWVAWANFSGGRQPAEKLPAWADGPERRWERLGHKQRRRLHVRRWDAATRTWGAESREPEPGYPGPPPVRGPGTANDRNSSHYPILVPLPAEDEGRIHAASSAAPGLSSVEEVAVLHRRAVPRALGWSVEAYRLRAQPDGHTLWSEPAMLSRGIPGGVDQPRQGEDASEVSEGTNMPVATAIDPASGAVMLAWQRHDRVRTAPGFHLTNGTSALVVAPLAAALPDAEREGEAVAAPMAPPAVIRHAEPPKTVAIGGETYFLVFGNLHRHAESSTCGIDHNGQAEWHMRHAPHVNRSAFLAVTDHGEHLNDADWREQCLLADFYTWPGTRAAFPGIEWTSEAPWQPLAHGHKNVIFSRSDLPFVDCWMPHSEHPERLWAWLREHDPIAVTIPHHTMRGKTPTFWEHVDEDFQPVVEIFQDHRGSAEWLGAPAATSETRVQGLRIDGRGSLRRAWDKGLRVGVIASGDHGGIALAGVYVQEISREGILEGLRARRCFATTGDRLLLDFRVNGTFQGGEVTLAERPAPPDNTRPPLTVTLRAEVLRPVQRLVLVQDGNETLVETPEPDERTIERTWEIESPFIGTSYFYVRIESADGELAWSSPVWVTREWVRRGN